jgi:predicted site-specific integrase-resolvase
MSLPLLRTRDVAELLDASCETVLRWHRSGQLLGGYRLNGSNLLRFRESEIAALLSGTRTKLVSVAQGSCDRDAE